MARPRRHRRISVLTKTSLPRIRGGVLRVRVETLKVLVRFGLRLRKFPK